MKRIWIAIALSVTAAVALAASTSYKPVPEASFGYNGSTWVADGTASTSPTIEGPPYLKPVARYCYNTGSSVWAPCAAQTNTIGCLDGYDHLPCTVYEMGLTSETTPTGAYATAYTTTTAGVYRITGNLYATTASSTTFSVTMLVKEAQTSSVTSHGLGVASATIGTSESWNAGAFVMQNLPAATAIQWETSGSGTNTSGVYNRDLVIERVK